MLTLFFSLISKTETFRIHGTCVHSTYSGYVKCTLQFYKNLTPISLQNTSLHMYLHPCLLWLTLAFKKSGQKNFVTKQIYKPNTVKCFGPQHPCYIGSMMYKKAQSNKKIKTAT